MKVDRQLMLAALEGFQIQLNAIDQQMAKIRKRLAPPAARRRCRPRRRQCSTSERRRFWKEAERAYLRKHYPSGSTRAIAEHLERSRLSVYQEARNLGLSKTQTYLHDPANRCRLQPGSTIGAAFRFTKGQVPPNKGLRRPGYAPGRMAETQFKKGARSGIAATNWRPIGTIMPDAEGFLHIKVRDAVHGKEHTGTGNTKVWPMYNRYIWEQHHGPIPRKHLVVFKDGDRRNCAIENLELMSMADNARRNSMWARYPRELAEAIQLQGALKRKLRNLDGKEYDQRPAEPLVRDARNAEG